MLLAAGIPMLIGYFIMLQMFNITYRRSLNQEAETILNAVAGSFDSAFSNIYDGIRQLAEEEIIRKNLENGDGAGTSVYRSCTQSAPNTVSTLIFPFMM